MKTSFEQSDRFFHFIEKELNIAHSPTARVLSFLSEEDEILAVVLYDGFNGYGCEMRIASTTPRWATKKTIREALAYPFVQLGCRRILAATESDNTRSAEFLFRVGFKLEGILRFWKGEQHALLFGMLVEECKWLKEEKDGRNC